MLKNSEGVLIYYHIIKFSNLQIFKLVQKVISLTNYYFKNKKFIFNDEIKQPDYYWHPAATDIYGM